MSKDLVIVESPKKARTINKFLGKDYVVKSSKGHIRDLPTKASNNRAKPKAKAPSRKLSPKQREARRKKAARQTLIRRMGVNPDRNWSARYEVIANKEKVVDDLRKAARSAEHIYLATDLDREGEAIAWHLQEVIGGDAERFKRVVFNEITERAVAEAFEDPGTIDENRVNAQQARRFLDRVVGFELTPLLYQKMARGLSAGRVQSVAVRLIVEREREIRHFDVEEYWEAFADLQRAADSSDNGKQNTYRFKLDTQNGDEFLPRSEEEAQKALDSLNSKTFSVLSHVKRNTKSEPRAPFTTSTLQQAASTRLGFSVSKTMVLAQRLYEEGHITYMRTDSTNLSAEAVEAARTHIDSNFGADYLPEKAITYKTKSKNVQEAHEAIRPSSVDLTGDSYAAGDRDLKRLYNLIWTRFVACQMTPARYQSVTTTVEAPASGDDSNTFQMKIQGRVLKFDGYTKVYSVQGRGDKEQLLPEFEVGEALINQGLEKVQHFTKPPARYREASLVRELEKRGIGRPSTYVPIISTIQERGYVTLRNGRFHAHRIGELVTDRLVENFTNLMEYEFTARMEEDLDQVALGEQDWHKLLDEFYGDFSARLEQASDTENGMRRNTPTPTDVTCDKCGRKMQIRTGSTGVFLGCEGYSLPPKERCTNTMNLVVADDIADSEDDEAESKLLRSKKHCSLCGTPMDAFLLDETRKLHICARNPDCPGLEVELGKFHIKGYDGPIVECDKCGSDMQLKSGRFGKYFGCTNEACGNTRKLMRDGTVAPPRADPIPMPELLCDGIDDHFILREGGSGLFLAASKFPRNRQTRSPLVDELLPHANELDPKFKHLLTAPTRSPSGAPTVIKFSRKRKEHFVASNDKKNWSVWYKNGQWAPEEKAKPKKRLLDRRAMQARG